MTLTAGNDVPGVRAAQAPDRPPQAWLRESIGWLALEATRLTYERQPQLWKLGEYGRARTIEDFTHHLNAVVPADEARWRSHLRYSVTLFDLRGFPQHWLSDAFATLDGVLESALPPEVTAAARGLLAAAPRMMTEIADAHGIDLHAPTRYDELR